MTKSKIYRRSVCHENQIGIENDRFQIACCRRRETVAFLYCHQQYNRRRRKMQEVLVFFDGKFARPTHARTLEAMLPREAAERLRCSFAAEGKSIF